MGNQKVREKKKPTFFLAVLPILAMILLLGVGYAVMGLSPEVLMLVSAAVAAVIAIALGYTWDDIMDSIVGKLSKTMPAIFILIIVGFLIGSWMIGGTIPMMVYYGLKIISPRYIAVTSFLVTAVVSVCTGTSWGSAGTIGVALMGVAAGMGAPLPMVAGAVVSGAYFGDKMSPLSDTTNLAPIAAGSKLYDHIGHMFYTTIPGCIICIIVYTIAGFSAAGGGTVATPEKVVLRRNTEPVRSRNKLVALACSTGGPKALQSVIPYLPKNLDAPMVLVQHMPAGFTKSMADRLNEVSDIHVKEAEDGDVLKKGTIYIAPGGKHMEIKKSPDGSHKIRLNDELPPIGGLKPCADITYDSLRTCGYDQIVCVVLTGMGADGTKGIKSLAKSKPVYVISQNAETCVVYGMPKSIAETGLVNEVVPLTQVAQTITKNVGVQ
jgi:hypothetical protein